MSSYLDASVIVALLTVDPLNARVERFFRTVQDDLVVSDLAGAEFASAIARRVRMRELALEIGRGDLAEFDRWCARSALWVTVEPADMAAATGFLRRLDLTLLSPDAIHIALARRLGARLVTLDRRTAAAAGALGVVAAEP
ncbi:MAG TPA: type II toxin-antitoxin system VapC family toxin [Stellaceae bacterium]|nr:type II toxin-antitoxin system VapC family toxin [Stellaceae bacterium]